MNMLQVKCVIVIQVEIKRILENEINDTLA
jgi:hypothetical protein